MHIPSKRDLCLLFGTAALASCSLIYDLSPDQCGTNSDCDSFGDGYRCESGMCVTDSPTGGTSGTTGTGGGGGVPSPGECETSADCLAENPLPRACIELTPGDESTRTCVELTTPDCPLILPSGGESGELWLQNLQARNSIVVGAFAALGTTLSSTFSRNYDLAFTQFSQNYTGVPGPNNTFRPLVVVVCDNDFSDNPNKVATSTRHLVDNLRVPGIVAGLFAADLQTAFSEASASEVNRNVYFISPLDSDPAIASLEGNLVWNLLPAANYVADAYGPLLLRTIDYLRNERGVPAGETIKVAVLVANDQRFLGDLGDSLRDVLQFNGMDFDENRTEGNLIQTTLTSWYSDPSGPLTSQIEAILDFGPHVIIEIGGPELFYTLMDPVEARWETDVPGQPRPFYLLSPYHYMQPGLPEAVNRHRTPDPLHLRMAGVNWAGTPEELKYILDDYNFAWDTFFPDQAGVRGYENWYDAPWWLIYALTSGTRTLTRYDGQDLADGMDRLMEGPPYAVGPDDIQDIVQTLSVGSNTLTLNGALGPPSFDSTGARSDTGSVWCVDSAVMQRADVLRVDPAADPEAWAADDLVGDGFMQCNPDF